MAIVFYKWFLTGVLVLPFLPVYPPATRHSLHPFYVSVTEIEYNADNQTLEIGCKVFTEDFEKTLNKTNNTKLDIYHPADTLQLQRLINDYIKKHLQIKVNSRPVVLEYVGYEIEDQSTWNFFQARNVAHPKKVEIENNLLYELFDKQISIMHVLVAGTRKSTKLDYPATTASFDF